MVESGVTYQKPSPTTPLAFWRKSNLHKINYNMINGTRVLLHKNMRCRVVLYRFQSVWKYNYCLLMRKMCGFNDCLKKMIFTEPESGFIDFWKKIYSLSPKGRSEYHFFFKSQLIHTLTESKDSNCFILYFEEKVVFWNKKSYMSTVLT